MAKEIHEQPEVVGHTLARYIDMASERVMLPVKLPFDFKDIQRISITACGTASYAGYVAKYWFERLARIPVELDVASEFRYREAPLRKGDLAIFISQSGETADTLAALRYAKAQGVHTLSVVNVPTSTIAREGALKLKEISYIHAEGYAAGELKHGPIALIDENMPVVVIAPYDRVFEKTVSNMQEVAARGGNIILMTDAKGAAEATVNSLVTIVMPDMAATFTPMVYAVPVQLL